VEEVPEREAEVVGVEGKIRTWLFFLKYLESQRVLELELGNKVFDHTLLSN